MSMPELRLLDALLRNDFLTFAQRVFAELNPGRLFHRSWYHETIAYFVKVTAITGKNQRLIINLPPRSAKSTFVSVALPAFLLGRDPRKRIIVVSYNQDLAAMFGRQTRQVMQSAWYRRLFPSTVIPARAGEMQFYTSAGGFRKATSVEGTLTGRGGDLIIVDDPQKASDAGSEAQRKTLTEWAMETLFTRLDDKVNGAIFLVQQRLHEEDLSGQLIRAGGWLDVRLPAIADQDERLILSDMPLRFHHRREGDLLDPVREPKEVLDRLRREMGSAQFLAQYQQAPVPPDGDVVKIEWFQRYDELPPADKTVLSIDTASKGGLQNDWSVMMLWRVVRNRYFLEVVWRHRVDFPELLARTKEVYAAFRPDTILVEDKGSGTGLIQMLHDDADGYPVVAYNPGLTDKKSRMEVQAAKIEGGLVFLPKSAPWLDDFVDEVRRFPNGRHDDQIDAMSQFLDYVSQRNVGDLIVFR